MSTAIRDGGGERGPVSSDNFLARPRSSAHAGFLMKRTGLHTSLPGYKRQRQRQKLGCKCGAHASKLIQEQRQLQHLQQIKPFHLLLIIEAGISTINVVCRRKRIWGKNVETCMKDETTRRRDAFRCLEDQPLHVRGNRKLLFSASGQLGHITNPSTTVAHTSSSNQYSEWVYRRAQALNTTSI